MVSNFEIRPIWTDTQDEVYSVITKTNHTSNHATIWRWRPAFQNDFFARMDWTVTNIYTEANHPPIVSLTHANQITVKSGEKVSLSANASDPDHDQLNFNWIFYKEVGTINASRLIIHNPKNNSVSLIAPVVTEPKTMHFIVEVTDNGIPNLTRYQRVIVTVLP